MMNSTQTSIKSLKSKIDEEFTEITQVLNHRFKGSKKNLANLELFLTWEDDPKPQWFPWNSSFRSVEVIHSS